VWGVGSRMQGVGVGCEPQSVFAPLQLRQLVAERSKFGVGFLGGNGLGPAGARERGGERESERHREGERDIERESARLREASSALASCSCGESSCDAACSFACIAPPQGYLAHKKQRPPRTLQQAYTLGPMVVLGGWAFLMSEEVVSPAAMQRCRGSPQAHVWTHAATPAAPRLSSGSPGAGFQGVRVAHVGRSTCHLRGQQMPSPRPWKMIRYFHSTVRNPS